MGGVFNHINCNLFAYAANNPVKYTDPDGRTSEFSFNYRNYFEGQLKGLCYGIIASFQDLFGKIGNLTETSVTKMKVAFYGEAELSMGPVTCTGTVSINTDGEVNFNITKPTDMLISEIQKIAELPVTIDTSGISAEIPITGPLYAVTGINRDDDGNWQLKLGAKARAGIPAGDVAGGVAGGAGILLKFNPSVQDGSFGTANNRKNDKLNENIQKFDYYNSLDFFKENIE